MKDQDLDWLNSDTHSGAWHDRVVDLSSLAGKTVQDFVMISDVNSPSGSWELYFLDIAVAHPDGTVLPVFTREKTLGAMTITGTANVTGRAADIVENQGVIANPGYSTTYYHGDHLGTARLLTDELGWPVWSGVFAPFGQEINPTLTANHYKFTGKERDDETSLDYFGARYYASASGRFMSSDPLGILKQKLLDPQQWDMYAYARNNPLKYRDPTGLYVCEGQEAECKQIRQGIADARIAMNSFQSGSAERASIQAVLDFYGDEGKKNGVVVKFGDLSKEGAYADTNKGKVTTITFDLAAIHHDLGTSRGVSNEERTATAEIVGHEGQHGLNGATPYQTYFQRINEEVRAYRTQSYIAQGLGVNSAFGVWYTNWLTGTPRSIERARQEKIFNAARDNADGSCSNDDLDGCH